MRSPLFHLVFALSVCIAVIAGFGFWYATLKDKSVAVADLERQIEDLALRARLAA